MRLIASQHPPAAALVAGLTSPITSTSLRHDLLSYHSLFHLPLFDPPSLIFASPVICAVSRIHGAIPVIGADLQQHPHLRAYLIRRCGRFQKSPPLLAAFFSCFYLMTLHPGTRCFFFPPVFFSLLSPSSVVLLLDTPTNTPSCTIPDHFRADIASRSCTPGAAPPATVTLIRVGVCDVRWRPHH